MDRMNTIGLMIIHLVDSTNLEYMLNDVQGSTVAVLNSTGTLLSEQRYLPFGDVRTDMDNAGETDFGYTGQREHRF